MIVTAFVLFIFFIAYLALKSFSRYERLPWEHLYVEVLIVNSATVNILIGESQFARERLESIRQPRGTPGDRLQRANGDSVRPSIASNGH